jgi:hypothetical protein
MPTDTSIALAAMLSLGAIHFYPLSPGPYTLPPVKPRQLWLGVAYIGPETQIVKPLWVSDEPFKRFDRRNPQLPIDQWPTYNFYAVISKANYARFAHDLETAPCAPLPTAGAVQLIQFSERSAAGEGMVCMHAGQDACRFLAMAVADPAVEGSTQAIDGLNSLRRFIRCIPYPPRKPGT